MAALGTPLRNAPRLIVVGSAAFFIILLFIVLTPHGPRVDLSQLRPSSHGSGNTPATDSSSSPSSSPSSVASNGNNKQAERLYGKDYHGHSSPADVNRVTNDTLGFSNVFVVGLAERSDKRDAIALASSLTGFRVEWVEGVRGDSIPDKAVPFGVDRKKLWETNLGSWRGHMNAIRRYVNSTPSGAHGAETGFQPSRPLKPLRHTHTCIYTHTYTCRCILARSAIHPKPDFPIWGGRRSGGWGPGLGGRI